VTAQLPPHLGGTASCYGRMGSCKAPEASRTTLMDVPILQFAESSGLVYRDGPSDYSTYWAWIDCLSAITICRTILILWYVRQLYVCNRYLGERDSKLSDVTAQSLRAWDLSRSPASFSSGMKRTFSYALFGSIEDDKEESAEFRAPRFSGLVNEGFLLASKRHSGI
jgi:hypothetical protein